MSANSSRTTTDRNEIRRWAEERGAKPACVKGTGGKGDPGMIRLDFPGFSGSDSLEHISWDEWFKAFDDNDLALVYQDRTADGQRSNFNKLVARDTADARAQGDSQASVHHGSSHSGSHSSSGSNRSSSSHRETAGHSASGSGDSSLKEREYRDEQGQVHHHTHTYMEQHGSDRDSHGKKS